MACIGNCRRVPNVSGDPSPKNWKDLIPHRPAVYLSRAEVFADYLVVSETEGGLPHIRVREWVWSYFGEIF